MGRPPVLVAAVALLAAGCGGERAPEPEHAAPPAGERVVVFDTTEPPEVVVRIPDPAEAAPPRGPDPSPEPPERDRPDRARPDRPRPERARPERPPAAPPGRGPSGSCDVRATEGYCFAYTGAGWSPRSARANCAGAPGATFDPGACPLGDRVATCAFRRPSEPDREILYTYYAPADLVLAELACPGTFTPVEDGG